ncbi:DciA family protein [Streptomyces agglomeratus]|uniref:DciA family protein n=1 Tax=Streptomyces agglomeratus TaxID=285458 RepID=UPI0008547870|nr:DciA family protein [Streptomyces agglomeratus]OEJ36315.1 hypothetical protein BGK72_38815 [Streptomyces agglomeratus]
MSTELSGVDLARQALVTAREAAKKNGGTQTKKPKRRTGTVVRRDGREPLGLGAAINMMMTERGMVVPAAGGSVLAQFDAILAAAAPELAGHIQAVGLDADTGRLDVVPNAPVYGTKLRWISPQVVAAVNEKVPGAHVRSVYVRPPASRATKPSPSAAAEAAPVVPEPTAEAAGPVKTRKTASAGYRRALAAHQAAQQAKAETPTPAAERTIRTDSVHSHARALENRAAREAAA